jgi:hypothetical protein
VAERYHGTRSLVTYTRNHKLYVANPAAGSTFSGPDQSSGDNIITGNETPLDLVHTCARPSICPAQNDIGVAIAYWYITDSLSGAGRLAVFYQKDNSSPWQSAVNSAVFMDATSDYHWVTPVLTPINDTAWIVAAGSHAAGLLGGIKCLIFITPHTGTPRFSSSMPQLAVDTIIGGTIYRALYPTVTSRPIADSLYPFRIAWQRAIKAGKHNIYYQRWRHLSDTTRNADTLVNVSKGLDACDNVHPSLALNGTIQNPCPTCDYLIPDNVFYDDHLTWEAKLARPGANSGSNYWPVIRARAELTFPHHGTGWWGVYNVQNLDLGWHGFHWPQVSTEPRVWNGLFWYPNNNSTVHDWIRVGFQNKGYLEFLSWTPNWYTYWPFEGALPSLAQSTSRMESWTDSSTVPHSFVFLPDPSSSGPQHVQITNAWLSGFEPHVFSAVLLLFNDTMAEAQCSGIIGDIILSRGNTLPTNPSDPAQNITWSPMDITKYGVDADWPMMPRTLNEIHTNNFKIHSSDSIFIDRAVGTTDFTSVRNALSSSSDFVTFRMTLRKSSDSSYLATMDSMSITKSTTYWAGAAGVSMDTSMVSFRAPVNDSAFAMVELIRGDSLDYLSRSYVESLDTLAGSPPAPKRSTAYSSVQEREPLVVAVYPNPSTGFATVNITSLTGGLPAVVKVYDVLDNEVATLYEGTPAGDMGLRLTFDGSHLAAGTYYIRAQNAIMGGMVKLQIIR